MDSADPLDAERHRRDLALLDKIARLTVARGELGDDLLRIANEIRASTDGVLVAIWELRQGRLTPRATAVPSGIAAPRLLDLPRSFGIVGRALEAARAAGPAMDEQTAPGAIAVLAGPGERVTSTVLPGQFTEIAAAVPGPDGPWGALLLVADPGADPRSSDVELAVVLADAIGTVVSVAHREDEVGHLLHRAEALRRVAGDIGSRLDLDRILTGLVDHAMVLFESDRAAVFMRRPDGTDVAEVSRNLSAGYLNSIRPVTARSLSTVAIGARRPTFAVNYRDDPRGADVRAAVVQEGYDTLCTAPLMDGTELLGTLNVYHDKPHAWSLDELETIESLATQASVAIRTAQNFQKMATWTAQLQSIQQLGARLNHLTSVHDIGLAIASELRQLIDFHNVRVYRVQGSDLVPVAMQGQVGEYVDETPDQLRVAVGEGITGWVAKNRTAQYLPDAAKDPRANTIPGTEDDLDESMLLAPMLFEDQVLGVLVLSKLGLHQFSDDDLRLLVIYASFAAQAMINADTTQRLREQSEALERQLRSQRELLQITETILTTLDGRAVLEGITDRLGALIACDNVAIEVLDPSTGLLTPLTARGVHAANYLEAWEPGETGVATWVVEHNEPVYIEDETTRSARQPVPRCGGDGRQPDRRPAARALRRDRRPHDRATRDREHVHPRGIRPREAVRGPGLDRPPERGGLPGRRDPRPDRRPDRPAQPRDVRRLPRPARARGQPVRPDHARPRRLPRDQQCQRPPGRRRGPAPHRRGTPPGRRPRRRPRVPLWRRRVRLPPAAFRRRRRVACRRAGAAPR